MESVSAHLLDAAHVGDKRKVKRLLQQGLPVDTVNNSGQSALQLACLEGHVSVVDILLRSGADANRRNLNGATAVHAAILGGSTKILKKVVGAGGDLRLHDSKGGDVLRCVTCISDAKKQHKMLEFIEKRKWMAQQLLPGEVFTKNKSFVRVELGDAGALRGLALPRNKEVSLSCIQTLGFGKIYMGGGFHGALTCVSVIGETSLKHDECGFTYNNGPFIVMESMYWLNTQVTVKRLHKTPPVGGHVDSLIEEYNFISRIRHPNILLLMGQCQPKQVDSLVLVYERVHLGSLFSFLYQKIESISSYMMCEIMRQICDAVIFLHQHELLHCAISSHAIHMVSHNCAKLGNFEYMIERCGELARAPATLLENRYPNAVYNWLAPEVMAGCPATEKSDLYSLVAVIWEILNGMPPWSGMQAVDIQLEMVTHRHSVKVNDDVGDPFSIILQYGLCLDPGQRHLSVLQLRNILHSYLLDEDNMAMKKKHLTPLWEKRSGRVEKAVLEEAKSESAVLEVLPTDSSQSAEESTIIQPPDSSMICTVDTSTPIANNATQPSSQHHQAIRHQEAPFSDSIVTSFEEKSGERASSSHTADFSDLSDGDAENGKNKANKKRTIGTSGGATEKRQFGRRSSSFLRNAARKVFARRRSDTEGSASERDPRNIKSSKSDPRTKKRKSNGKKSFPFDVSGVSKLNTDSSQPASERETIESDQSHNSQDSTNPFKKFNSAKYEDIISDEIKEILAKPIAMPKLPSHFRRLSLMNSMFANGRRESVDQPGSVYNTLVRHYSQGSQARRLLSPPDVAPQSLSLGTPNRSVLKDSLENSEIKASASNHSLQSLNSSTVKPASHHTPDKNDNQANHLPHFAFPRLQRHVTQPGNVSFAPRQSAPDANKSSPEVKRAERHTSTATQTVESSLTENGASSSLADCNAQSQRSFKQQERKAMSQRDIFFGIKPQEVASFRSDSFLGVKLADKSKESPRGPPKPPRLVEPGLSPECGYSNTPVDGKKSVKDIVANFQCRHDEHMRKQATLVRCHKKTESDVLRGVFHTPAHLKPPAMPRAVHQVQINRAVKAVLPGPSQISVASIYLEKPGAASTTQQPSVGAHGASADSVFERSKQAVGKQIAENFLKKMKSTTETGSETEEEVSNFIGRVIKQAHTDVIRRHTPAASKSDTAVEHFVRDVIETMKPDVCAQIHDDLFKEQSLRLRNNNSTRRSDSSQRSAASSSDEQGTCKRNDPDIEEIYFDDVLDSSLCRDKNMRLQSTMALDTPEDIVSVFREDRIFSSGEKESQRNSNEVVEFDETTPRYPRAALSGRRFKFSRTVTRVTEDEAEDTEVTTDHHDSSGTIDV